MALCGPARCGCAIVSRSIHIRGFAHSPADLGTYYHTLNVEQALPTGGARPQGLEVYSSLTVPIIEPPTPCIQFTDDFERADGAIGPDWVQHPDVRLFPGGPTVGGVFTIDDGAAVAPLNLLSTVMYWHEPSSQDGTQFIEIVVEDVLADYAWLMLHVNMDDTVYASRSAEFEFVPDDGELWIYIDADDSGPLSLPVSEPVTLGLYCDPTDGTMWATVNGVTAVTAVDPDPAPGEYVAMEADPHTGEAIPRILSATGGCLEPPTCVTFSDNFERADGPVGSNWVLGLTTSATQVPRLFTIATGAAISAGMVPHASNPATMSWTSPIESPDQFVEVVFENWHSTDTTDPFFSISIYNHGGHPSTTAGRHVQRLAEFRLHRFSGVNRLTTSAYSFNDAGSTGSGGVFTPQAPYTGSTGPQTFRLESYADGRQVVTLNGAVIHDYVETSAPFTSNYRQGVSMAWNSAVAGRTSPRILSITGGCLDAPPPPTCTDVLTEPFDNLTAWTSSGTPTIVTGRTGTAAQADGNVPIRYDIPTGSQTETVTLGFAWRRTSTDDGAITRDLVSLYSDDGATLHNKLRWNPNGQLSVLRGPSLGLTSSAVGALTGTLDTWYYIEWQIKLGDSPNGWTKVWIDGTEVINATGLDTRNSGTKTVYDRVSLGTPAASSIHHYDDLYLSTGAGCAFQGDPLCYELLSDPCDNLTFAPWSTVIGTPSITTGGHTGNGISIPTANTVIAYDIAPASQTGWLTTGCWIKLSVLPSTLTPIVGWWSDTVTQHVTLRINTTTIAFYRTSPEAVLGAPVAHGMTLSTWYYLETSVRLSQTEGQVICCIDGTTIIDEDLQDTMSHATKDLFGRLRIGNSTGGPAFVVDDIRISSGPGCAFQGDPALTACTDVLTEPFDNLTNWAGSVGTIIAGGRTGNALQIVTSDNTIKRTYTIPTVDRSDYVTLGFALNVSDISTYAYIFSLLSDGGTTSHLTMMVTPAGGIQMYNGGPVTSIIGQSATGVIAANTWYYIELQAHIADTGGSYSVRVNGAVVLSPTVGAYLVTGGDTRYGGTGPVDGVALRGAYLGAVTSLFDDLYLSTGAGCTFQGDPALTACTDVLTEPFNNFTAAPWTLTSTPTIQTGRTGTCAQFSGTTARAEYNIPTPNQADTITVGFAWRRTDATAGGRTICDFWSDSGATQHNRLTWSTVSNTLNFTRSTGTSIGSATFTFVQNTWYYIEVQVKLHDTTGSVVVRIDGVDAINATGLDTKNAGTKTVYDQFRVMCLQASAVSQFDDLYLSTGAGCAFKGDPNINPCGDAVLCEPFNNFTAAPWTDLTSATIVTPSTPRTATACQMAPDASGRARYVLPVPSESDYLTVGFGFRVDSISAERKVIGFLSDVATTPVIHASLSVSTIGSLLVRRGDGTLIANSSASLIVINTWYFIEVQIRLHDSAGFVLGRVDVVERINATGLDSKHGGTKSVFDAIQLYGNGVSTSFFDDLYLSTGSGATFKGPMAIPAADEFPVLAATDFEIGGSLGAVNPQPALTGVVAGDLLVAFVSHDSATVPTASMGWTSINSGGGSSPVHVLAAFGRVADGGANDSLAVSGAISQDYCCRICRITGHGVTNVGTDIKSAVTTATSANPDPPSLDAGSSRKWLWLAVAGVDVTTSVYTLPAPTGYTLVGASLKSVESSSTATALAVAERSLETQTEDPAVFTNAASRFWITLTIAIPPA